jgi:CRP/FNR family transcriptional regulator
MSFRFRVVPKKKHRGVPRNRAKKVSTNVQIEENCFDGPLMNEQIFYEFSSDVRERLGAIASTLAYSKGEILFAEGQKAEGVFVLHSGSVKLSAGSADGKSIIVGRADQGEMLGLPTVISGRPNELTAEALESLECNFIDRDVFLQFLVENGDAALRVAEILSNMYDAAFDQARYLGLSASAPEKLARLLLQLSLDRPHNAHSSPITHKEIAEMIGLSRETVTRMLARFKRARLIQTHNAGFRVLDRPGLEQLFIKQL